MNPSHVQSEGDVVKRGERRAGPSAQEQLARWELMEKKLTLTSASSRADARTKAILGNMSEIETIRLEVLEDIIGYKESTPEFAQLYNLTGSKDPYEQADWLAEKIYEQQRAESIMAIYTPGKKSVQEKFIKATTDGLTKRQGKLTAISAGLGGATRSGGTAMVAALAEATGLGSGSGETTGTVR